MMTHYRVKGLILLLNKLNIESSYQYRYVNILR